MPEPKTAFCLIVWNNKIIGVSEDPECIRDGSTATEYKEKDLEVSIFHWNDPQRSTMIMKYFSFFLSFLQTTLRKNFFTSESLSLSFILVSAKFAKFYFPLFLTSLFPKEL